MSWTRVQRALATLKLLSSDGVDSVYECDDGAWIFNPLEESLKGVSPDVDFPGPSIYDADKALACLSRCGIHDSHSDELFRLLEGASFDHRVLDNCEVFVVSNMDEVAVFGVDIEIRTANKELIAFWVSAKDAIKGLRKMGVI